MRAEKCRKFISTKIGAKMETPQTLATISSTNLTSPKATPKDKHQTIIWESKIKTHTTRVSQVYPQTNKQIHPTHLHPLSLRP